MDLVAFFLGLGIGLGIFAGREYRLRRQLRKLWLSSCASDEHDTSLQIVSLLRRELQRLQHHNLDLNAELQSWQGVLSQAPIGYLKVNSENQLLWCNSTARSLLQIDRWQNGQLRLLLELVRSYELDCLIETTRQLQQPQTQEWIYYCTKTEPNARGAITSTALTGYTLPLEDGSIGVFILNRQSALEISRERDRAFSDLIHELRTPLTSISLVAETLTQRLGPPEQGWVEKMLQQTARLLDLIENWLDLSQLQANPSRHLNLEKMQLKPLVDSVWHTLEPIAAQKSVTLDYQGSDVEILADRSRLYQVFLNLLDNAIKHSPDHSSILVEVAPTANNFVAINVIDCGSGFLKSDLPYVFERLYRGDKSRTRSTKSPTSIGFGSGLGLAIASEIIMAHQGTIEARNHPATGGAWLKVILPIPTD